MAVLAPPARAIGQIKKHLLEQARAQLTVNPKGPNILTAAGLPIARDGSTRAPADLLALEGITIKRCQTVWPELAKIPENLHSQLETDCRYAGYLERQQADIDAMRRDDAVKIPNHIDISAIGGLSAESKDLLSRYQPQTIGQASRIPGMTPAAIVALLRHLRKASAAADKTPSAISSAIHAETG